jgi:hypothetical protein
MVKTVALAGVAALAVALSACGSHGASPPQAARAPSTPGTSSAAAAPEVNPQGDIPDNQQYVTYAGPGYTVKVPEGWARTTGPTTATFGDKLNSIRVATGTRATAPTAASLRAEVAALGRTAGHVTPGPVQTVHRRAGTAIVASYRADAPADPVTGKVVNDDIQRYEFWRAGHLVTLTLAGPHGADNVDPWRIVTDSFRWTA